MTTRNVSTSVLKLESRPRKLWTQAEDEILRKRADLLCITHYENTCSWLTAVTVNQEGLTNAWSVISNSLPGRTNKDCRKRWTKVCKQVNKGAWDASEDEKLLTGVKKYGQCWTAVAQVVNTRHADQCAKRWQQSLDPNLSHAKWKESDHRKLFKAVEIYGRRWKQISSEFFPERSTTDLKNREKSSSRSSNAFKRDIKAYKQHNSDATMVWEFGKSSPASDGDQDSFMSDNVEHMDPSMMSSVERDGSNALTEAALHENIFLTAFEFPSSFETQYSTSLAAPHSNSELDQMFYGYSMANSDIDLGETFSWRSNSVTPSLEETLSQFMMTGNSTPIMPPTPEGTGSTTTLVLEDVDAVTLSQVIAILTERNTKMKMESGVSQVS